MFAVLAGGRCCGCLCNRGVGKQRGTDVYSDILLSLEFKLSQGQKRTEVNMFVCVFIRFSGDVFISHYIIMD